MWRAVVNCLPLSWDRAWINLTSHVRCPSRRPTGMQWLMGCQVARRKGHATLRRDTLNEHVCVNNVWVWTWVVRTVPSALTSGGTARRTSPSRVTSRGSPPFCLALSGTFRHDSALVQRRLSLGYWPAGSSGWLSSLGDIFFIGYPKSRYPSALSIRVVCLSWEWLKWSCFPLINVFSTHCSWIFLVHCSL